MKKIKKVRKRPHIIEKIIIFEDFQFLHNKNKGELVFYFIYFL